MGLLSVSLREIFGYELICYINELICFIKPKVNRLSRSDTNKTQTFNIELY